MLLNNDYEGAKKLGNAIGYKYAHDYPEHYVKQQYLPDDIKDMNFYEPSANGREKEIGDRIRRLRSRQGEE